MNQNPDDDSPAWDYEDETEYTYLKLRYSNRKKLSEEAENKRKSFKDVEASDPLYHRMAVSAEMAKLRLDMAYIVERNNRLEEIIGTVSFLHQRLDILEGAYGHVKMLAESSRIDYKLVAKALRDIKQIKEELSNAAKPRSDEPDGAKG